MQNKHINRYFHFSFTILSNIKMTINNLLYIILGNTNQ